MQPLYTQKEYQKAISSDLLPCKCKVCESTFYKQKRAIAKVLLGLNGHNGEYCSRKCMGPIRSKSEKVKCRNCEIEFKKKKAQISKSPNHFCSKSCAGTYNTLHKTHGTRRSKLEVWLEEQLPSLYPSLEFHFNRKDAINSELDIYIPSLKLAFELNGLFHYEPIFGPEKLAKIQNNDERKYQACIECGIELCLIDVSSFRYFKAKGAHKYLNIIMSFINTKTSIGL